MLYAYFKSNNPSVVKSEKELFLSIHKAYELYYYLLLLLIDIKDYAREKIEIAREKKIPTYQDLNPNMRFVNNPVINNIEKNEQFQKYVNEKKLNWIDSPELIKNIYTKLVNSGFYSDYMSKSDNSNKDDKKVIISIYEQLITDNELLYQILEEKSIYWNDDIEFMISMIIRTVSKIGDKENYRMKFPEMYKNDDDVSFVKMLFRRTIENHEENISLIDNYSKNWELERIAFMDILLLEIAITEIKQIPSIPVKVSFNEYIELAKFYSTSKSSVFVNGILDKIINHLKQENKIKKTGRGLIGSV